MGKRFVVPMVIFVFVFWISGCAEITAVIPARTQAQQAAQQQVVTPMITQGDFTVWDFGQIKAGQVMKHEFTLSNDTRIPLAVREVNTSCGCTVSEVKKKSLMPGEKTAINITFNSAGYSGPVEQFIYVHTDRTDNPVLKFTIRADVVK